MVNFHYNFLDGGGGGDPRWWKWEEGKTVGWVGEGLARKAFSKFP